MTLEDEMFPEDMPFEDRISRAKQFLDKAAMRFREKFDDYERLLDSLPRHAPVTIEDEDEWQMIRWLIAHFLAREATAKYDREKEAEGFDFDGICGPSVGPDSDGA